MKGQAVYVVSPTEGGEPYRVTLREDGGEWVGDVERGAERWSFRVVDGPAEGLARTGDRPLRWSWDPLAGRLTLNGGAHSFGVQTEAAFRLAAFASHGPSAARVEEILAPMPGLVLQVETEDGASVAAGQGLVVLEAMKMENEITAPVAGIVCDLAVQPGETLERGALLCRIRPAEAES